MPREKKDRQICLHLPCRRFETGSGEPPVELAPDEIESLRLVDLEELDQREAAERMGISRGTLQRLLYAAHRKLAFALVAGHPLTLGEAEAPQCGMRGAARCRFCPRKWETTSKKGVQNMKIAVTCENNEVFQHFGHTPAFAVYTVEDNRIEAKILVPTEGSGHGALAAFLKAQGADVLLCGGIGGGAQIALAEAGIKLVGGVAGDVDDAVRDYLMGTLQTVPNFSCNHHHGDGGHSCGGHGGSCHHGECGR